MPLTTSAVRAEAVLAELHDRLRAFVGRRVNDPHAADDIAQDVLLRLHRSLDDLRSDDRLDAFAYRIARNAIIDHYRASAGRKEQPVRDETLITRIEADLEAEHDDDAGRQELARCLRPVVDRLPEPYREALTLTDLGELSQVEAARIAGLSAPGMKARVQRARAQVRDLLAACCTVALDADRQIGDVAQTGPCACGSD